MSLGSYLRGLFRTTTPAFEEGQELTVFVTGHRGGTPVARVGDTVLRVIDAPEGLLDSRVRIRVTSFDANDHTGEAEYLERVGESVF
ncbi:hypothetical protein ACFQPA_08590 [Halomarina halobia]|uniref:DUF7513 domain-containing protein n=1 Tax=Halomarina halobia TaxID=3033386 RepID=A0ABD6AB92_9EURY|nr:hypothetical protein [Halomarina sp. PSR21]